MFLLYNLFSAIILLTYLPSLFSKRGPENRLTYLSERLGLSSYSKTDIWAHAVSVGETLACLPFLKRLKKEFPEKKIVFSTTTYTGQKIAREKFPEADRIMYMPWDTELCIRKAVSSLKPELFITVETELWPVLFQRLKAAGSAIVLLNGRVSLRSFKGYKLIRPFMKKVLSHIDYLYMQGETDAERITALGADRKKVGIMGNLKFDIEIDKRGHLKWTDYIKGKILLAGSTHKGEEEIILDAYKTIKEKNNDLRLLLAPRHPERFSEVEKIIRERGLTYIRRSELPVHGSRFTVHEQQPDIILLDTIGELPQLFSRATITFIGGSLLPYGGHNILEPACWGKPIIFGPYMDNFPIAKEFLTKSAALVARNSTEIVKEVSELLKNPEKAEQMGENARIIIESNKGAIEKALELVRSFIGIQNKPRKCI